MKKIILYTLTCFTFISCIDCEKLADLQREDECLLIVKQRPDINENYFNFKGIHPYTNNECDCESGTSYRWWSSYSDKIDINDTIIKKKGELIFNIHKKDTVLSFDWKCKGRTYH